MYCRKCGKKIPDESVFCPKCGEQLVTRAQNQQDWNGQDQHGWNDQSQQDWYVQGQQGWDSPNQQGWDGQNQQGWNGQNQQGWNGQNQQGRNGQGRQDRGYEEVRNPEYWNDHTEPERPETGKSAYYYDEKDYYPSDVQAAKNRSRMITIISVIVIALAVAAAVIFVVLPKVGGDGSSSAKSAAAETTDEDSNEEVKEDKKKENADQNDAEEKKDEAEEENAADDEKDSKKETDAKSSETASMPDLTGKTLQEAESALKEIRVSYVTEYEPSDEAASGTVLRQSVEAGDKVQSTDKVTLVVASAGSGKEAKESAKKESAKEEPVKEEKHGEQVPFSASGGSRYSDYQDGKNYSFAMATDGDITTSWDVTNGVYEYIDLTSSSNQKVKSIAILGGKNKGRDLYDKNNRPKGIKVELGDGSSKEFILEDAYGKYQTLEFEKTHEINYIRISITSIYRHTGTWYGQEDPNDCCIAEIEVFN